MHDHQRRNIFEIRMKTPFLLKAPPELRASQIFENARRDPAGDVNASPGIVRERHVSGEPAEHRAKHIERRTRCRANPLRRGGVISAAFRNGASIHRASR